MGAKHSAALVSCPGDHDDETRARQDFNKIHTHCVTHCVHVDTVFFEHAKFHTNPKHPYSCLACELTTTGVTEPSLEDADNGLVPGESGETVRTSIIKNGDHVFERSKDSKDGPLFVQAVVCWQCSYIMNIEKLLHRHPTIPLIAIEGGGEGCKWERAFLESNPRSRDRLHYIPKDVVMKMVNGTHPDNFSLGAMGVLYSWGRPNIKNYAEVQKTFSEGQQYLKDKYWKYAIKKFKKCVELDSSNAEAWYQLGYANYKWYNDSSCEASYEPYMRCIMLDPPTSVAADAYYGLGSVLEFVKKDYKGAERMYRKAIALKTDNVMFYYRLGVILGKELDDIDGAEKMYQKCLELDPNGDEIHKRLGLPDVNKPCNKWGYLHLGFIVAARKK